MSNVENNEKTSIDMIDALNAMNDVRTIRIGDVDVHVKRYLSMDEAFRFIARVSSSVFGDNGEFKPEVGDVIQRIAIVESYTDIVLPDSGDDVYTLLFCTDIVDKVLHIIDTNQYRTLVNAIDNKIKYQERVNTRMAEARIEEATDTLNNLAKRFESVFSNIDDETINAFIKAFSKGDFTEEGLVKALLANGYNK